MTIWGMELAVDTITAYLAAHLGTYLAQAAGGPGVAGAHGKPDHLQRCRGAKRRPHDSPLRIAICDP